MSSESSSSIIGIGITSITAIFVVLRLTSIIDWPWLLVISPLLIWAAVAVAILFVALVAAIVSEIRP